MKTTRTIRFCEITIRRPNGQVETLCHPKVSQMTQAVWDQFCRAMATGGRGEGLSYENLSEEIPLTLEEQRKELVWDLSAARDRSEDAAQRAHASSVGRGLRNAAEAVEAAEKALAEFDAAHPEIREAIEAKRAAEAKRRMWD